MSAKTFALTPAPGEAEAQRYGVNVVCPEGRFSAELSVYVVDLHIGARAARGLTLRLNTPAGPLAILLDPSGAQTIASDLIDAAMRHAADPEPTPAACLSTTLPTTPAA